MTVCVCVYVCVSCYLCHPMSRELHGDWALYSRGVEGGVWYSLFR